MLVPYTRNGGMIGATLDFDATDFYGAGGTLTNVDLISVSINGSATIYPTTVDCSTVTANDALIILTQGETGGGQNNNSIVSLTVEGVGATLDRSTTNAAGAAHVSISRVEGSVVAGNASASVNMEYAISLARQSYIFYRLVGGANATVASSSENETSGQASISTSVTANTGNVIFSSGYFSNDQSHSFSINNGTLTETTGVVSGSGSGDGMFSTDATGNVIVTFNRSGGSNTQGDAIVAVVYQGAGDSNKKNSGIWDLPAVYDSKASAPTYSLGLTPSLLTVSGTNDAWTQQTVDVSAYSGATVRLAFRYANGNGFEGDLQIDNIDLDGNSYSFENVTHSFETSDGTNYNGTAYASVNFQSLAVESDNRGVWQVDQGGTPSGSTGRTDAAAGTYYVYIESSSPANTNGFTSWLRSPQVTLSGSPTLTFFEARNGGDIGSLDVYLEVIS